MPRDTVSFVEALPDLSVPSLEGLSWLLRHSEQWPAGFVWDYGDCDKCAMGLAAKLWHHSFQKTDHHGYYCWSINSFKLSSKIVERIFYNLNKVYGMHRLNITPIHVADAIDEYLVARGT